MLATHSETLFWLMSAALLLLPLGLIGMMPPSRVRELWWRSWTILLVLVLSVVVVGEWFWSRAVSRQYAHSAVMFWVLTALLLLVPLMIVLTMPRSRLRTMLVNGLLWLAGAISLILGIIGAVLPVMPTVPFILLTAACWGRASPRFHRWLAQHKYFGPMVQNWQQNRAISRKSKYFAWTMMTFSSLGLLLRFPERWYVGVFTGLVCLCVGIWMARLPDA